MASTVKEKPISMGPDLLAQTRHHIAFLQMIWEHNEFFNVNSLRPALKRYREFWLPLVAKENNIDKEPPLDIHWIWYLHMMRPLTYYKDCMELIQIVPEHTFNFLAESRETIREHTRELWQKYYPESTFDCEDASEKEVKKHTEKVPWEHIIEDVKLEKRFAYQILLPHYIDPTFLASAMDRYKLFLQTSKSFPDFNVAPIEIGYDIELLHRSHMAQPVAYRTDMCGIFGEVREFHVPASEAKVIPLPYELSIQNTDGLIRVPGAMFRGDPLFHKMVKLSQADIFKMAHKACHIDVKRVRVEHLNYQNIAVVIGLAKWSNFEMKTREFLSAGRAPFEWKSSDGVLLELDWTSEGYEQFYVTCYRRRFRKSRESKALIGCLFDKFLFEHVDSAHESAEPSVTTFTKTVATFNCEARFTVGLEISAMRRLGVELTMKRGEFEWRMIPEHIKEIWGPLMLEKLPAGVSNKCTFAMHRFENHRDNEVLSCRVIHSLPLRMSAVEVLFRDKMVAVSHLIASETCPTPEQVKKEFTWPTLNPIYGERAMVIKNCQGDWGVLKGRWLNINDSKKTTIDGKAKFRIGAWDLKRHRHSTVDISLKSLATNYDPVDLLGVEVDFKLGRIKVPADVDDVAEAVVMAMSAAVLMVLCLPKSPEETSGYFGCCGTDASLFTDLQLLWAAGFSDNVPSNEYLTLSRIQGDGTLQRQESTAWKEFGAAQDNRVMTVYHWLKPAGMNFRQDSFDVEVPSRAGSVNRSFDLGFESPAAD